MTNIARVLVAMALVFGAGCAARAGDAKFPTDEAVRVEMKAMRDLTLVTHSLVTHRRLSPADAQTFNAKIKACVGRLESGTMLRGEARAEIAAVVADISKGAASVAGLDTAMPALDGIVVIDEALVRYADRFDHPGWEPLR